MRAKLVGMGFLLVVGCGGGGSDSLPTAPLDAADGKDVTDGVTTDVSDDTGIGLDVSDAGPKSKFATGHVFLAGSRNAEVLELDETLKLVTRWTHPSFGTVLPPPGQSYDLGPAGMAFDASGNLVVAGVNDFCVFSEPSVLVGCHPKVKKQPTENVIFDHLGNLYTTTSTGGTNEIHKYAADFTFVKTFSMPTGELTGVTCDPTGNLFIGSQLGAKSAVYKVDKDTLTPLATISLTGTVEGLQYGAGDTIWAAMWDKVVRFDAKPPYAITSTFSDPGLAIAVPITIDEAGNVYTADYENGSGTAAADLYVWAPDGKLKASRKASEVWGPFGIVVGGTRLPCGAYRPVR
jgi:sugar lactone lactonase YvrE